MMNIKLVSALFAIIGLLAGLLMFQGMTPVKMEETLLSEFTFQDIHGIERNSKEWLGKVLIINFWATWCPPCREEIPEFIKLQNKYNNQGLQFVGIAIEEQKPAADFAKQMSVNYPILIAETGGFELSVQLGNTIHALPFSVVVDQNGKIIYTHSGIFKSQEITEVITPLFKTIFDKLSTKPNEIETMNPA